MSNRFSTRNRFFWGYINQMGMMKYWEHKKWNIVTAKEKIPQKIRIGDTCFTCVSVVGGKLYSSHPQNRNCVHKNSNDLLSAIITLGTNVSGGGTFFNDGIHVYYLRKKIMY